MIQACVTNQRIMEGVEDRKERVVWDNFFEKEKQ